MEPQIERIVRGHDVIDSLGDEAPMSSVLSADDYKLAFRGLAAGVAVVTAEHNGAMAAMTATSVASLSATPPLFIFSASQLSSATAVIAEADTVVVHILTADQLGLAILCATNGANRFADKDSWRHLPTGEPHFPHAAVWIRGRIVHRFVAGSSILHVVEALSSNVSADPNLPSESSPLVYHNRTWHGLSEASRIVPS